MMRGRAFKVWFLFLSLLLFATSVSAVTCNSCSSCTTAASSPNAVVELNQSISTADACVTIGANNVTLNCMDFTISGPGLFAGGAGQDGVIVEDVNDATILNCTITGLDDDGISLRNTTGTLVTDVNSSGNTNFGIDITAGTSDVIIKNSTMLENFIHIRADNLNRSQIVNNSFFNVCGGCSFTILFNANNDNNNITANSFDNNTAAVVIRIVSSTNDNNVIWNNNFRQRGISNGGTGTAFCVPNAAGGVGNYYRSGVPGGEALNGSCGKLVSAYPFPSVSKFGGSTLDFNSTDSSGVSLILEILTLGKMVWNSVLNADHEDFDAFVNIGSNFVSLDAANLGSQLNSSTNITLESVSCPATIFYAPVFASDANTIISNNRPCNSTTSPACTNIACSAGNLTFTVANFDSYASQNSMNLSIWDDVNDPQGKNITPFIGQQTTFYADFKNSSGTPNSTDGACQIDFNQTGTFDGFEGMTYNGTSGYFQFNSSFSVSGNFHFLVNCTFVSTLSAVDDFVVSEFPLLTAFLIDPASNTEVTKGTEFTFSSGVNCTRAACGNVSASLDPSRVSDVAPPIPEETSNRWIWIILLAYLLALVVTVTRKEITPQSKVFATFILSIVGAGALLYAGDITGLVIESGGRELVATDTDATPFWTDSGNPQTCSANLGAGESCNVTWNVFATGDAGTYEFFVIYNASLVSNETDIITITILPSPEDFVPVPTGPAPEACENECSPGERRCAGASSVQVCGNFDPDACVEWGSESCGPDQICSGGECVEALCVENWVCSSWGRCSSEGQQTRLCSDFNDCGTEDNKPNTVQSCAAPALEEPAEIEVPILPPGTRGVTGCIQTVQLEEEAPLPSVDYAKLVKIPGGFDLIEGPINFNCAEGLLDATLSIPSNYVDVRAIRCKGLQCNPIVSEQVTNFVCGKEQLVTREILRVKDFIPTSELQPVKPASMTVSQLGEIVRSGKNSVELLSFTEPVEVSIEMTDEGVQQPVNPSLNVLGTPIMVKIDKAASFRLTMPYMLFEGIDEDSTSIYAETESGWERLGALRNIDEKTVSIDIDDISPYVSRKDSAVFAVYGISCENCDQAEFKKVYDGDGSRHAVVLVHGLDSSPATFDLMINDIVYNRQPWQLWTFSYSSSRPIDVTAKEFGEFLEIHRGEYDTIHIVGHSLGAIITQEALLQSSLAPHEYLSKVKTAIMVGSPNDGSPAADVFKNLHKYLSNLKGFSLFNVDGAVISQLAEGVTIPQVPGIDYKVVAGAKGMDFNLGFFELFEKVTNDGIINVTSAQHVGDEYLDNSCLNYWEVNVTHTDLIDEPLARGVIGKILSDNIPEQGDIRLGYNQYFKFAVPDCSPNDQYFLIGRPIEQAAAYDAFNCLCGNNICGEGEDEFSCPQDCERRPAEIDRENLMNSLATLIAVIAALVLIGVLLKRKKKRRKKAAKKKPKRRAAKKKAAKKPGKAKKAKSRRTRKKRG